MKVITRNTLAAIATERWRVQYKKDLNTGNDKDKIYSALVALGKTPAPEAVNKAIGNGSWTQVPDCSECGKKNERHIIQVGEESDYESNTAYLCGTCINRLQQLIMET